jgi:hypothetical protein
VFQEGARVGQEWKVLEYERHRYRNNNEK